jgi:hypothetical protein
LRLSTYDLDVQAYLISDNVIQRRKVTIHSGTWRNSSAFQYMKPSPVSFTTHSGVHMSGRRAFAFTRKTFIPFASNPGTVFGAMTDLERSHAELRAALMLAGKRIVKLNCGRRNDPALPILRRVLRDVRAVARREGVTQRVRLNLPGE